MIAGLNKRITRLEEHPRFGADTVGVATIGLSDLGIDELRGFASAHALPSRCGIWFVDGPPALALSPAPVGLVRGEDEVRWTEAGETFPHVVAVWNDGEVAAWRFDSRAEQMEFDRTHGEKPERCL